MHLPMLQCQSRALPAVIGVLGSGRQVNFGTSGATVERSGLIYCGVVDRSNCYSSILASASTFGSECRLNG